MFFSFLFTYFLLWTILLFLLSFVFSPTPFSSFTVISYPYVFIFYFQLQRSPICWIFRKYNLKEIRSVFFIYSFETLCFHALFQFCLYLWVERKVPKQLPTLMKLGSPELTLPTPLYSPWLHQSASWRSVQDMASQAPESQDQFMLEIQSPCSSTWGPNGMDLTCLSMTVLHIMVLTRRFNWSTIMGKINSL